MTDLKEDAYDSEDAANPPSEDDGLKDEETVDEDLTDDEGEKGAGPGQKLQAKWEEMYKRLLNFKEKHGHCLVPNRYAEDPQLGSWVSTQRRHYKILTSGSGESTPMTPARAQKLVEIGFKWSTKDPRHVPWEHRYKQLIAFKEKYGHAQVPIGWEENIQLSNWVSTQRQEYKLIQRGRQSRLTQDRIDLLNKVDFVWEAQRGGPRRKRKATVAVPPKANPVDMGKLRAKANRGKPTNPVTAGGAFLRASALQQGASGVDWQQALAAIGGTSVIPGTVTIPASQWQLLANGAFQKAAPQAAFGLGAGGASLFPLASQVPFATSGFQFGMNPLLAQLQQQQQAALLLNAGVLATGSQPPEEGRKRPKSSEDDEEEEDEEEEEVQRKPRGKKRRNSEGRSESSGEREGDVF